MGSIVSLGGLACRRTLLKAANGEQHLLLRAPNQVVQIRCVGEDLAFDPFALELVVDAFPDVESRQKLIGRLADLYRGRETRDAPWTPRQLWHRDALIAFDARAAGLTHRKIACLLYGEARVMQDWTSPARDMKNRIARAIRRARRLVAGGYRALLR